MLDSFQLYFYALRRITKEFQVRLFYIENWITVAYSGHFQFLYTLI